MAPSARDRFRAFLQSGALKVALVYLVIGLAWIFFSDNFAFAITHGSDAFLLYSELKGFGFIIVTTLMLYILILHFTGASEKQQQLLFRYETRYRKLYESMRDAFASVDMAGRIKEYNPAFREMLGYSDEELREFTYRDITPERWHESEERILKEQVLLRGYSDIYEKEYRRKDGTIFPVALRTFLLRDDTGQPAGLGAIARDITERKRAEETLRESEEKLRLFIRHAPAAIVMFDRDMHYIAASRRWIANYHLEDREILGRSHYEIFPEIPDSWKAVHRRGLAGEVVHSDEDRFVRADGTVQWLTWEVSPWFTANNTIGGIVIFSEEITERKKQEQALQIANQKLNLMNTVAWHDIYNKISGLQGYVELSREHITDQTAEEFRTREEEILKVIQQQILYTKEYQEIGQQPPRWHRLGSLLDTIRSTGLAGPVRITDEAENLEIYADPVIEKVFWHLIDNSVKHGKRVTEIRITARESASGCTLVYQDDGVGIPEDKKPDLFTRSFGKMSGFDLFFVHDILGIYGMKIDERGEPGKGVLFEISMPRGQYRFAPH
jgi:PAS domain S-box-containing protein